MFNQNLIQQNLIQKPPTILPISNLIKAPTQIDYVGQGHMPTQFNLIVPPQVKKSDMLKKIFFSNLNPLIQDEFFMKLLKLCGPLQNYKRPRNEKDIPMNFGCCEFESIDGVLKSLRILNGKRLLDRDLSIKPDEKTEVQLIYRNFNNIYIENFISIQWLFDNNNFKVFINEWLELKKREYEAQKDNVEDVQNLEQFMQKDDTQIIKKINLLFESIDIDKIKQEKEKELLKKGLSYQNKEHQRERDRAQKKDQYKKDHDRRTKELLQNFLDREKEKEKEYRRQKEKERDIEKDKKMYLQKELDDAKDKKKKMIIKQRIIERKQLRIKEKHEDAIEFKREYFLQNQPPIPEFNCVPQHTLEEEVDPKKNKKSIFTSQQYYDKQYQSQKQGYQIDMNINQDKDQYQRQQTEFDSEEEIIEEDPRFKKNLDVMARMTDQLKTVQDNKMKINDYIRQEKKREEDNKRPKSTNQSITQIPEEVSKKLEKIITLIPKRRDELFEFKINWELFEKSNLIEKKLRAWLVQKSIEQIGLEEQTFIGLILKKVAGRESPKEILRMVEKVLEDDAEDFVIKMWRTIIFEVLKIQENIITNK